MSTSESSEYQEATQITFEWTLKGLKSLFDATQGDAKSKVTKSVRFGGGRWQILLYANSGLQPVRNGDGNTTQKGNFISLYLSCEPTQDERDASINGKWLREGTYNFEFQLRPYDPRSNGQCASADDLSYRVPKLQVFNRKEANNHSFSYKTANWGWAQFASRDLVYYNSSVVKQHDAFTIWVSISSSPTAPAPAPAAQRQNVPRSILDAVGALLDDSAYSDVEFVLPRPGKGIRGAKRIYAAKRLLQRAEYFEAMFNSGFSEGSGRASGLQREVSLDEHDDMSLAPPFDDSDDESDDGDVDDQDDGHPTDFELVSPNTGMSSSNEVSQALALSSPSGAESAAQDESVNDTSMSACTNPTIVLASDEREEEGVRSQERNVRPKLSHPSSPRSRERSPLPPVQEQLDPQLERSSKSPALREQDPSAKMQVVVRDVAYNTYRATLYYVYTDSITFAPLSSSFLSASAPRPEAVRSTSALSISALDLRGATQPPPTQGRADDFQAAANNRREWIADWVQRNPDKPAPCSAKSVYRLADRLDLRDLKERAFQHILKSLDVDNVGYEVFSGFSATFSEVRKVQVRYFLDNWSKVRCSNGMRKVWEQIRLGRHPGFEEVWPVIALSLEFKPQNTENATGDVRESNSNGDT